MTQGPTDAGEGRSVEAASDPSYVLRLFVTAARAGDFESVRMLLSVDLRTRYDARALQTEHASVSDMVARDLAEIERALDTGGLTILEGGEEALIPLGGGRSVRMVKETGGWRIASLH